jgi:hypothetical protein
MGFSRAIPVQVEEGILMEGQTYRRKSPTYKSERENECKPDLDTFDDKWFMKRKPLEKKCKSPTYKSERKNECNPDLDTFDDKRFMKGKPLENKCKSPTYKSESTNECTPL